jgi:hypothetical protein
VLTASEELEDVNQAYHLGASTFLVKLNDFNKLVGMMRELQGF